MLTAVHDAATPRAESAIGAVWDRMLHETLLTSGYEHACSATPSSDSAATAEPQGWREYRSRGPEL
jgi:hypothetical protein